MRSTLWRAATSVADTPSRPNRWLAMKTYTLKRDTITKTGAPASASSIDPSLNEAQQQVVEAPDGPILVIAGAGSGKTRVLTARVAWLVQRGVPIDAIMLLTFTNRSAREMTERVERALGASLRGMAAGTFHSVGRRIVQEHAVTLGFPQQMSILDQEDAETLIQHAYEVVDPSLRKERRFPRATTLRQFFSRSVNTGRTLEDIILSEGPAFAHAIPAIYDILVEYQNRKLQRGLMDFDDLLVFWHRLLHEHPAVADNLSQRYRYILVDEYQDTNRLQAQIVDRLAQLHGNVLAVGDDHQSIYSFRGADHENILTFPDRFPDCQVYRLEENYRCTPQILGLANASIAHNAHQFPKTLFTRNPNGELPALIQCRNEEEEAAFVAQRILELRDDGVPLDKIAVLYRAHQHGVNVELEFRKRDIPYQLRSGLRFFERAHIKDVISFLRLVLNPRDDLSAYRIFRLCDGVGDVTARKLALLIAAYPSVSEAFSAPAFQQAVPKRAQATVDTLAQVLCAIDDASFRENPARAATRILDGFYASVVEARYDLPKNRLQDLESLRTLAERYNDTETFLMEIGLDPTLTASDLREGGDNDDGSVTMSTVHQAKGLEFHTVFVLSMVDERFPHGRSLFDANEYEEERRLFYVAITRAQKLLYLCRPLLGTLGREGYGTLRLSPFIQEIAQHQPPLIEAWSLA